MEALAAHISSIPVRHKPCNFITLRLQVISAPPRTTDTWTLPYTFPGKTQS